MNTLLKAALLCALSFTAYGATSAATATITDSPDGQTWNNCSWSAVLVSPRGSPTIGGVPVPPAQLQAQGACSSSGVLTVTLADTSTIDQAGATYTFTLAPNASVTASLISGVTVVGATPNLSSQLSVSSPRFPPGNFAYGYLSAEVMSPTLGATYFNTGTATPGSCQLNLSGWTCGGGSSGALFPSTAGVVCNTSTTASLGCTSQQVNALSQVPNGRVIYNKNFFANLSDWTVVGQTPTLVAGSILINPTTIDTFNAQTLLFPEPNEDENADMEVDSTISTVGTGFGLVLGRFSVNTATPIGVAFIITPSLNQISLQSVTTSSNTLTLLTSASPTTPMAFADVIRVVLAQRGELFTAILDDVTQHTHTELKVNTSFLAAGGFAINTSEWALMGLGGSFYITDVTITSRQPPNPDICVVGDSKTAGYDAGVIGNRWASNLKTLGSVAVFAGPSDRTAEALLAAPYTIKAGCKKMLINIGRNDICGSTPTATWQANYQGIISAYTAANIPIVQMLSIPETACTPATYAPLNTFIEATYPTANFIDPSTGWISAYLASDGIHPSIAGSGFLSSTVIASGFFPVISNPVVFNPTTADALFPSAQWGSFLATPTNCSSSASPAACGTASSGSAVVAAGATSVVVNTTAITPLSQIQLTFDSSLGTKLGVTCNTIPTLLASSARVNATSFTVTTTAPTANPACFSYTIVN